MAAAKTKKNKKNGTLVVNYGSSRSDWRVLRRRCQPTPTQLYEYTSWFKLNDATEILSLPDCRLHYLLECLIFSITQTAMNSRRG